MRKLSAQLPLNLDPDLLLSVPQVATWLGMAPVTIRKMLCTGKLSFVKIGASTRIRKSDVESLIVAGLQRAAAKDEA